MAFAGINARTKSALTPPTPSRLRLADRYSSFGVVAIGLLVNLGVGLFARQAAARDHRPCNRRLRHRIHIHQHVHLAQTSFQHYVDDRIRAVGPDQISKANELLEKVLEEMDVAIERSSSPQSRARGQEIRANITALPSISTDAQELADRTANIQQQMEQLGARNSAVGLKARDDIEESSFTSDLLLLASIVTSIMLAGLALLMLHRMIASMKQRSSAQLSAALEGMPQGLIMFDGDLRLIVCNGFYAAMYGLRTEHTSRAPASNHSGAPGRDRSIPG